MATIHKKILYFISAVILLNGLLYAKNSSVTFLKSGGRFGDNLIAFSHALYFAHKNNFDLLYDPFPYADQLVLDNVLKKYRKGAERQFDRIFKYAGGSAELSENCKTSGSYDLFVIPYFPEAPSECRNPNPYQFPVDWEDPAFKELLRSLIKPKEALSLVKPRMDKISVAVHARLGGGFDHFASEKEERIKRYKIPYQEYYIEQIKRLSELLGHAPLYVFLFTDDQNPAAVASHFAEELNIPTIEFDYRRTENRHNMNVLEDFFSMTQFDCLIRSESNYSIMAEKLGDFSIIISVDDPLPGSKIHQGIVTLRKPLTMIGNETIQMHQSLIYNTEGSSSHS